MTLEQQVANLVSATTELTNVVNGELTNVRIENNTFKNNTLNDIDTRFNDFIQGFDEVKFVQNGFTVYVASSGGSSAPQNPVNNQADPFDTINNAYGFLLKYYWTNGPSAISLLPGTHTITAKIACIHPCLIRIVGANVPDFASLHNLLAQTTNTNRESAASIQGSNASLLNESRSLYQSIIEVDIPNDQECVFAVYDNLHVANVLIYQKNLGRSLICAYLGRYSPSKNPAFSCTSVTFAYFSFGIHSFTGSIDFQRYRTNYFLGNGIGIYVYNTQFTNKGELFYCSGNTGNGLQSINSMVSCAAGIFSGNGGGGIYSHSSNIFADACQCDSNASNGFYLVGGGSIRSMNSFARNNGYFGYRSDSGLIFALGSDANASANVSGKKFENNAQQGYVIGVNP